MIKPREPKEFKVALGSWINGQFVSKEYAVTATLWKYAVSIAKAKRKAELKAGKCTECDAPLKKCDCFATGPDYWD